MTNEEAIEILDAIRDRISVEGYCAFLERLKKLPSTEPDIIACGDCKHYICHERRCGYWNHGVKPLMWCSQAERRTDDE